MQKDSYTWHLILLEILSLSARSDLASSRLGIAPPARSCCSALPHTTILRRWFFMAIAYPRLGISFDHWCSSFCAFSPEMECAHRKHRQVANEIIGGPVVVNARMNHFFALSPPVASGCCAYVEILADIGSVISHPSKAYLGTLVDFLGSLAICTQIRRYCRKLPGPSQRRPSHLETEDWHLPQAG